MVYGQSVPLWGCSSSLKLEGISVQFRSALPPSFRNDCKLLYGNGISSLQVTVLFSGALIARVPFSKSSIGTKPFFRFFDGSLEVSTIRMAHSSKADISNIGISLFTKNVLAAGVSAVPIWNIPPLIDFFPLPSSIRISLNGAMPETGSSIVMIGSPEICRFAC